PGGPARDPVAHPPPDPVRLVGAVADLPAPAPPVQAGDARQPGEDVAPPGAPAGPYGTSGQNARRPKMASSAGSSVICVTSATRIPMAAIGPRPEVPLT